MVDDEQDEQEAQEIPLPNVKSAILARVIEFAQHYRIEPMTEIEKVRVVVVSADDLFSDIVYFVFNTFRSH